MEYLESVHVGEFMTGTMDEVKEQVHENMKAEEYEDRVSYSYPRILVESPSNIRTE